VEKGFNIRKTIFGVMKDRYNSAYSIFDKALAAVSLFLNDLITLH